MTNEAVAIITSNKATAKAYRNTESAGNPRLDFNDVIWDEDIKAIADTMRKAGIKEFTISVPQGNLLNVLAAFQELGVFIHGVVQVRTRYKSDEGKTVPALIMQVA